jgi:hypothetical protein
VLAEPISVSEAALDAVRFCLTALGRRLRRLTNTFPKKWIMMKASLALNQCGNKKLGERLCWSKRWVGRDSVEPGDGSTESRPTQKVEACFSHQLWFATLALNFAHYNFCRIYSTLKVTRQRNPALRLMCRVLKYSQFGKMKKPSSKKMPSARIKQLLKARVTKTTKREAARVLSEAHEAAVEFLLVELKAALTFLHGVKDYSDQARIEQGQDRQSLFYRARAIAEDTAE